MTNTVDWSNFGGFKGVTQKDLKTAFGDVIGGAAFEVGVHKDVFIDSIEPKVSRKGNPYLRVVFKNDNGAQISKTVMLSDKKGEVAFSYRQLAAATAKDPELRLQTFSEAFMENPALLDGLRGMKMNIKIDQGKSGYIIKKDALGDRYVLVDVTTDEPYPELADASFEDFTTAKEAANENMLERCYNEVTDIKRGSNESIETNETALREILRVAESGNGGIAAVQSGARRPAI